jgi:uracil-DNA glycosylase
MNEKYYFPFGMPLKKVVQKDKSPKQIFVLGVYAGAVHAKWVGNNNKTIVRALAVASEPSIFWKGDNADKIISKIKIPQELGKLIPASKNMNGPSGIALDEMFLKPLGYSRDDSWLCDLLPYSRMNLSQKKALQKHYTDELVKKYSLNEYSIPEFNKKELKNDSRRNEIIKELKQSNAKKIILLGDLPIRYFLKKVVDDKTKLTSLKDFGTTIKTYGKYHSFNIDGKSYEVLPLVHPRQAKGLGRHSKLWFDLHAKWVTKINK